MLRILSFWSALQSLISFVMIAENFWVSTEVFPSKLKSCEKHLSLLYWIVFGKRTFIAVLDLKSIFSLVIFQYIICSLKSLEWKVTFVASVGNYFLGVCLTEQFGMCLFHPPCMQLRMHLAEKLILQRKMHGIMQNKESLASASSLWVHLCSEASRKKKVPLKLKKKKSTFVGVPTYFV